MGAVSAAKPIIKVAAICGSLRKGSYNRGLLRAASEICQESISGMQIEYVDISPLPMLNTDLEVDGKFPAVVETFRQKILEFDSFLFASPEYNYSVTGPLKNVIDWASRAPNVWADKAAAIVSAGGSFGGGRSQYHLRQIGVYLDLHFINKPEFFLKAFESPAKFDDDGNLLDESAKDNLKEILLALQAFTLRLQGCNFNVSTISKFPRQSGSVSEERAALTPFTKDIGQRFHASAGYKLGRTSGSYDWHDLETCNCNNEGRVISQFQDKNFKLKDRIYNYKARARMYKMALVASWVFFLIVFILSYWVKDVGNACCRRNMFGKSLDLWEAYS